MKKYVLPFAVLLAIAPVACGAALPPVMPGAQWEMAKPDDCGFDAEKLAKLKNIYTE